MAVKNKEKEKKYVRYQEGADMYSMSVSTQTCMHTIKKTRIVAGFQEISINYTLKKEL